jgi:hypothetical protein
MNKILLSSSVAIAAIMGVGTVSQPAQALEFFFGPKSESSNTPATGASARVQFTFTDEDSDVRVKLKITNTTGLLPTGPFGAGATESKLTAVGFDILDGLSASDYAGSSFFPNLLFDGELTPFGTFDLFVSNDNNILGGNPGNALPQGQFTHVDFLLSGWDFGAEALEDALFEAYQVETLRFVARFQDVNAGEGSDKLLGGQVVPTPALLPGLLGIGIAALRKKQQDSVEEEA